MTVALLKLLKWTYKEMDVEKIYLRVFGDNSRAIALYERSGFKRDCLIPLEKKVNGDVTVWDENFTILLDAAEKTFLKMIHKT